MSALPWTCRVCNGELSAEWFQHGISNVTWHLLCDWHQQKYDRERWERDRAFDEKCFRISRLLHTSWKGGES